MRVTSDHAQSYGQGYEEYYAKMPEEHQAKWDNKRDRIRLSSEQVEFLKKSSRPINVVIISENWCPDCAIAVQTIDVMKKESNYIKLNIINRQLVPELLVDYEIHGQAKIPIVIFLNEKYEEINRYIEKSTYYWTLLHEAKTKGFDKSPEEEIAIKNDVFSGKGQKLVDEVVEEIFVALQRAYWIANAANPLQELDHNATPPIH